MRLADLLEGRELDDRAHFAFEQDRQHDDVEGPGLAEARGDADVVGRNVADQDPLLLERALPDESLTEPELRGQVLATLVRIAGLEGEVSLVAVRPDHAVKDTLLRIDQGGELGQDHLGHGHRVALALQHAGETR